MKSLLGITDDMLQVLYRLEEFAAENEGEIPLELWDELVISKGDLDEKLSAYEFRIQELKGETEILKEQIKIWQDKIEARRKSIDRMNYVLSIATKELGERTETGNYKLKTKENNVGFIHTKPVVIEMADRLPNQFKKFTLRLFNLNSDELETIESLIKPHLENHQEEDKDVQDIPIKKLIKETIEKGEEVPGASIDTKAGYVRFY